MGNPEAECECPPWCIANHDEQTESDDRWHQSQPIFVPVVELVGHAAEGGFQFSVEGIELEVELEHRVDGQETFLHFGVGKERDRNFRLSVESTRRLLSAIQQVLEKYDS